MDSRDVPCMWQVLKHEWPARWSSFIPNLVAATKSSETLCENYMAIFKLLSEEKFDFSRGEMTQQKIKELKPSLNSEFRLIHELCLYVLPATQRPKLIRATLATLHAFLSWIPVGFIFESPLLETLSKFFSMVAYQNLTLQCLRLFFLLEQFPMPTPMVPVKNRITRIYWRYVQKIEQHYFWVSITSLEFHMLMTLRFLRSVSLFLPLARGSELPKNRNQRETLAFEVFPTPTAVAPRRRDPPAADADAASSSRGPGDDAPAPCGGRVGASTEVGGVGFCEQATKALSLRSPFDGEEAAGRDPLLPVRVARWAALGDVRKKHKKAQQPEAAAAAAMEQPRVSAGSKVFWEKLEPFFREITLEDFEALVPKPPLSSNRLDPCLLIPFVGSGKELRENCDPSHVSVADESSHLNSNLGKDNAELENNIVHSKQDMQDSSDFVGGNMELVSNNGTNEEHCEHDMQEVILQQEDQPEIELDQGRSDGVVLPECSEGSDDSLNWLLGARDRFVLTSERPNKKRKLLGADAGLERLVLLPPLEGEAGSSCDVCCLGESGTMLNRMLHCNSCEVSVHQKCYGVHVVPNGHWLCAWCKSVRSARRLTRSDAGRTVLTPCVLCPKEKGALKPVKRETGQTADGGSQKFVHLFCSLWTPEVLVEDMESMEPVTDIGDVQENHTRLVCSLCKVMHGACVQCSYGTCGSCFHPICARESKHQMEIWGKSGQNNVEMRVFCSKHSTVISPIQNDKSATEQDSTQFELDDANLVTGKKQQLRFTHKNKDKFMNNTATGSSSSSLNKVQTELVTSPSTARSIESQETQSTDMVDDRPTGDGNLMSNSGDVSTVLRKLIDQGKVSVGDIESELGLSSESLEAALVPETTTFSPGLKLKIIKLLQNSVHVPSVQVKSLKEGSLAQGTLLRSESKNLTDTQLGSELEEGISSFDHCFPEGDNANKDWADSVENGFRNRCDCNDDQISGQRFLNFDGYRCYIHPIIEEKLLNLQDHISMQHKHATYYREELSCPHDQNLGGSTTKLEQLADIAAADQVSKAKSASILEHSPHDEIEGELVYLQSRLLDDVVAMKQRYEDLILKVVQCLSHELDSFHKRKWDHILANQYLRDIREAKKRGNTERRHKEAQAILAAAAPSVASTSQNATVRKEAENDVISAKQESIPKVNTGSSRVSQLTSLPQTKDSSLSNSKVSADTDFGIFDLAKFSKKNALPCDVCMRYETVLNRIFVCSSCKAAVHLDCYKSLTNSTGPWKCEFCQEMPSEDVISGSQSDCNGAKSRLVQCSLCHGTSGAFRKTTKGQWVHAFCAEWLLEGTFRRGQYNAVDGMESLLKDKDTCSICHHNVGTCLKCSTVDCQLTFHPACARDAGLYMNTKNFGSMLRHKAYCGKHSIEQRKADCQQYGSEEVKSMKQMRVELEILRLLCERIVKREKAKKDLAVCGHDILAARRDSTAFLMRTSYYASAPGASLESATTSVNNNSYSGTMQRSDDVTVDSTISRKHTVRLHNMDADRNTADSSTSTISYKRKLDDEESLADKNLPERPATASQKSGEEMKSTDQKHRDTSQMELVMTSDRALLQNQCPRKRYVYTRRSSMSKKKQWSRDVEGPGG